MPAPDLIRGGHRFSVENATTKEYRAHCAFNLIGMRSRWRRNRAMVELFNFISLLLTLYIYILVAAAVMSWLIAFNVVNPRNQFVAMVGEFLYRITEPVLRPIRRLLPNMGGIDISPLIVIVIIWFIQLVVLPVLLRMLI